MPFLMLGCFIPAHPVIILKPPQHFMAGMSQPRREKREYTIREYMKWKGVSLFLWYFTQVEEWVGKPEFSTKDSQM